MPRIGAKRKKRTPNGRERYNYSYGHGKSKESETDTRNGINSVASLPSTPPTDKKLSRINSVPDTPRTTQFSHRNSICSPSSRKMSSRRLTFNDDSCDISSLQGINITTVVNSMATNVLDLALKDTAEKRQAALDLLARYPTESSTVTPGSAIARTEITATNNDESTTSTRLPLTRLATSNVAGNPWNPKAFFKKRHG